jgi:peptidoglycan/xylan/chitin deacetylase (PgdA/CDA1 family)
MFGLTRTIRRRGVSLATTAGLHRMGRALNRSRLLIVAYHGVVDGAVPSGCPDWHHVTLTDFTRQLEYLNEHYDILPIDEALARPQQRVRRPIASITFDDGYRNNRSVALPVLERLRIPATIYLTTGLLGTEKVLWTVDIASAFRQTSTKRIDLAALGLDVQDLQQFEQRIVVAGRTISILKSVAPRRRDAMLSSLYAQLGRPEPHSLKPFRMMDWTDVTAMEATSLISFGAHTVHHEILSQLPDEDLRYEIVESIAEVRAKTSTRTRTFAYPNGSPADYDERAKPLLEASDVSAAVSTIGGLNSPRTDPFALRRVTVGRDMTFAQFRLATSGVTHGLGRAVARIPGVRARHTT